MDPDNPVQFCSYGAKACQSFHEVLFDLEDDNYSVQSQKVVALLNDLPMDDSIPFHDYYFAKEDAQKHLKVAENKLYKVEKSTTRIPQYSVQSRAWMVALFAGVLVGFVLSYLSSLQHTHLKIA